MDLNDVFNISFEKALESMVYAYSMTRGRNNHRDGSLSDDEQVRGLTDGQKDVLAQFGELYGAREVMEYIFLMDQSPLISLSSHMSPENRAGATYHNPPYDCLFADDRLTDLGKELVDSLVGVVNGDVTQAEVDTISFCIGFDDFCQKDLKRDLEQYVANITSYEAPAGK